MPHGWPVKEKTADKSSAATEQGVDEGGAYPSNSPVASPIEGVDLRRSNNVADAKSKKVEQQKRPSCGDY